MTPSPSWARLMATPALVTPYFGSNSRPSLSAAVLKAMCSAAGTIRFSDSRSSKVTLCRCANLCPWDITTTMRSCRYGMTSTPLRSSAGAAAKTPISASPCATACTMAAFSTSRTIRSTSG
ncbi:Uncharacterised protein [Bordetella pertussis]|nr:Uncharacterised protein [Bordetella pertussis]